MKTPDNKQPSIDNELSELEQAIETRERKAHEFEVPDILGQSGKALGKVRMVIPTIAEQDQAVKEAYAYAAKIGTTDLDVIQNAKTAHILHKVCKSMKSNAPAFSSPEWMLKKLAAFELGILLNNYNEMVRKAKEPIEVEFDSERLQAFAVWCANSHNSKEPNQFLQNYNTEQITEIAVRMAILYHEVSTRLKSEIKALEDKVEALEGKKK